MKKRAVIWSSFMVVMLFGVFTMFVKAQTTTTYYLNNRNELFQGAPANSNCGEIAACIKTTTGITGSNISYNASKDQVTVNGLNAKELRIYASKFYLTGNESKADKLVLNMRTDVDGAGGVAFSVPSNGLKRKYSWKLASNMEYKNNRLMKNALQISASSATIYAAGTGNTTQLKAQTIGNSTQVVWKSSNTNIATVSNTGLVTGKSKGPVQITATANGTTCICNVNVIAPRVTVSMSNASIYAVGSRSSFTLTATVNGTNKDAVTWSSSNTRVAKVTNGVVQGTGAGNATITASFAGSKATCSVNVMRQTISMSGGNPIYAKGTGSSTQLTATVNGTVGNDAVAWTSGNTNIAKVSGGKVTGVGAGTVTITATSNGVSTSKSIQVKEPTIKLDRETANIYPPATKTVTFTVTVNGVQGNSGVTWTSGNTKVATVSNGKVTAVGKGTATITAKANGKLAKAKVTVKDPYANVSPTSGTIKVGKTLQLTTNYAPASTGTPSYSSSNKKVAIVDSKGVVKGVKAGTATIIVKVNGVTAKAEITVK